MDISRRRFAACILGGLAGRLLAASRPKVLLFVILEQFRLDYIEAAGPQLSAGGFRRLMEKGAWFPGCRNLASTFSASSLATLATGAWPAEHGIVADSWYDRAARRTVPASDEMLLATTLAAQVAADPRSHVSVIGLDSGHARLFAGSPDADVYWMDDDGQFAMRGEAPDWLAAFNQQHAAAKFHDHKWQALGARPDAPALRTMTFDEKHPDQFLALYQASPFAQDAQFDLAAEVINRDLAFQGTGVHFVCLLAGSMARLGYETGARSPLMQQMTLQLDRRLESLLGQLDHAPGDANFALALAGAHGAPPAPSEETWRRMAVDGKAIADPINQSLISAGLGRVEKYVYPFLYLDSSGFRDPEPIRLAAARAAMSLPAVAGFYTAGGACSTADEWRERYRNSFHLERSGDVMLSYRPEYVEDFGAGRGVSYGSLYNYDVCVPLAFLGPPFRPAVHERPVESVDIAPTLARVMDVSLPSSSVGRTLGEALA
jgi:hypothetical protein